MEPEYKKGITKIWQAMPYTGLTYKEVSKIKEKFLSLPNPSSMTDVDGIIRASKWQSVGRDVAWLKYSSFYIVPNSVREPHDYMQQVILKEDVPNCYENGRLNMPLMTKYTFQVPVNKRRKALLNGCPVVGFAKIVDSSILIYDKVFGPCFV